MTLGRKAERWEFSPFSDFNVVGVTCAERNRFMQQVWQSHEQLAGSLFDLRDFFLDGGDFYVRGFGFLHLDLRWGFLFGFLKSGDFLRADFAVVAQFVKFGEVQSPFLVSFDEFIQHTEVLWISSFIQVASDEFWAFPDKFDVQHVSHEANSILGGAWLFNLRWNLLLGTLVPLIEALCGLKKRRNSTCVTGLA